MTEAGIDPSEYGYASIQADGGIAAVADKVCVHGAWIRLLSCLYGMYPRPSLQVVDFFATKSQSTAGQPGGASDRSESDARRLDIGLHVIERSASETPLIAAAAPRCDDGGSLPPERTAHILVSAVHGLKHSAKTSSELRRLIEELLFLALPHLQ